ncbi:hypothetical protein SAMN05192575_109175 [Nocardioides alpinus]|nr:hypothetical protein [Nocardioides alpinus]SFB38878.1 hypothetical protein SAMN05192575_109175 [Nocardioides alpinus]
MTIADLLTHHGHKKPRWVDVDGRMLFSAPAATSGALALKPHTFHSGEDPVDSPDPGVARSLTAANLPWWSNPDDLEPHRAAMAAHFPGFTYFEPDEDRGPAWIGVLDSGRGRFRIGVVLRRDRGLPFVTVLNTKIGKNTRYGWTSPSHAYISGNPCIADQDDWNPDEDMVATAVAWTAHWLAAYTEWRITNRWPIEGFHPNVAA